MKKVFLDSCNTIESVEWRHRGHTVSIEPNPSAWGRYNLHDADGEWVGHAATLQGAKEIINALAGVED